MIRPNVFLPGRVFGFKTSGRVFYIKTLGCLHFKHPAGHFTYTFEVWSWNYLRRISWSGNFIFLYFWKRTWVLKYTPAIRHRWKSRACYTGELLLLLRLWICARRSYFRKSFGRVISERSKAAPGYVMESQRLVFWWNEATSESKEPLAHIIDREIFFTQNK